MDSNQNCYTTSQWSKRISYNWRVESVTNEEWKCHKEKASFRPPAR